MTSPAFPHRYPNQKKPDPDTHVNNVPKKSKSKGKGKSKTYAPHHNRNAAVRRDKYVGIGIFKAELGTDRATCRHSFPIDINPPIAYSALNPIMLCNIRVIPPN